jgi:hypothetical protein
MQKHYFELDKVDSITLTHETETSYRWFPEIPARPKTFLGIQYGMYPIVPAGWNDNINKDGKEYLCSEWDRKQSAYFKDYSWYRVDEVGCRVYNKARVEIRLGYKQSFGKTFDSNEEAQTYVDDLILCSDKEFHVIINK